MKTARDIQWILSRYLTACSYGEEKAVEVFTPELASPLDKRLPRSVERQMRDVSKIVSELVAASAAVNRSIGESSASESQTTEYEDVSDPPEESPSPTSQIRRDLEGIGIDAGSETVEDETGMGVYLAGDDLNDVSISD
jgi:hypothetical protein